MRIGFDITPITATRTGVGNYCYYLLKQLVRMAPDYVFTGFSSGSARVQLDELEGAVAHRHLAVPTRLLYQLWTVLRAPNVDRLLGGVDIYHATNFFLPPTRTARRVVTIHDLAFLAVPHLCDPKSVRPFSKGMRRFAAEADAIMAYSECTKRDIVNYLRIDPEKVTVAPMAVDEDFVPVTGDDASAWVEEHYGIRQPYLLFVSTIEPRKNVAGLVRAFALLAKDIPHNLVLVGSEGWQADATLRLIDDLNLTGRVIRPGFVPHSKLPAFYGAADAFVFPTFYEGFGLPLLEAMVCGCPVVTSNSSSIPEVTGDAAIQTNADDIEGIAGGVRKVLEDRDLRERMIARGRDHARKFSWQACAETTLEVYRRLAAG